jgi:hypothetical protein
MLEAVTRKERCSFPHHLTKRSRIMGEAAKAYWLEEFINPSEPVQESDLEEGTRLAIGDTDDDWKFGSD